MTHIVVANQKNIINLSPESLTEEVLQNVAMIISTPQYTVPLDRGFGLPRRFIDKPLPVARAILVSEVLDAIEKYEPRAVVRNISFVQDEQNIKDGKLIPQVEVIIDGE
ncbi:GPW/gp25 family protein [Vallitalea guaymasensis]|uniref:GPW/gp25 family protein n=1 Tax=Vallitalea guaymasensis TaxID=1185412 RepID=UPI000DE35ADB|nr:GPW/gp25 family protein [Vallitalea guaymasensis]